MQQDVVTLHLSLLKVFDLPLFPFLRSFFNFCVVCALILEVIDALLLSNGAG